MTRHHRERRGSFEATLAELRARVEASSAPSPAPMAASDLTQALHELDVCYAELEIQNQDLRQTQTALATAVERYRGLFDDAPVAIVLLNSAGIILEANRASLALLERERRLVIGRPLIVCLGDEQAPLLFRYLGSSRPHESSVELAVRAADGPRTVALRAQRAASPEGAGWLCHLTDLTALRAAQAESAKLERRLRDAEKLEAVGRVAANIAHEVNNVLASIVSLGEFSVGEAPPGSALLVDLQALVDAAWRGARLMRGLAGLSRSAPTARRPVDLVAAMRHVASVQHRLKPRIRIVAVEASEPLWVLADEDELTQAIVHVVKNGLDAMIDGELALATELVADTDPPRARVVVRDQGVGMSPEVAARAFEPLFTTKASSASSGLGLTLAHKAITSFGGTIDLTSVEDVGTTVRIELPLCEAPSAPAPGAERGAASLPFAIVVVDDDEQVRTLLERTLRVYGARVASFSNGPAALHAVEGGLPIDAALLDVDMPGWSGPELARRLLAIRPSLPLVFLTGATGELVDTDLVERGARLLRKPWHRGELLALLSSEIAAAQRVASGTAPPPTRSQSPR